MASALTAWFALDIFFYSGCRRSKPSIRNYAVFVPLYKYNKHYLLQYYALSFTQVLTSIKTDNMKARSSGR